MKIISILTILTVICVGCSKSNPTPELNEIVYLHPPTLKSPIVLTDDTLTDDTLTDDTLTDDTLTDDTLTDDTLTDDTLTDDTLKSTKFNSDLTIVDDNYSPGEQSWNLPTQEDRKKWINDQYIQAMNTWAKPKLSFWHCTRCKTILNKDFVFLDRNLSNNTARFKSKCSCGHKHTIILKTKDRS